MDVSTKTELMTSQPTQMKCPRLQCGALYRLWNQINRLSNDSVWSLAFYFTFIASFLLFWRCFSAIVYPSSLHVWAGRTFAYHVYGFSFSTSHSVEFIVKFSRRKALRLPLQPLNGCRCATVRHLMASLVCVCELLRKWKKATGEYAMIITTGISTQSTHSLHLTSTKKTHILFRRRCSRAKSNTLI